MRLLGRNEREKRNTTKLLCILLMKVIHKNLPMFYDGYIFNYLKINVHLKNIFLVQNIFHICNGFPWTDMWSELLFKGY